MTLKNIKIFTKPDGSPDIGARRKHLIAEFRKRIKESPVSVSRTDNDVEAIEMMQILLMQVGILARGLTDVEFADEIEYGAMALLTDEVDPAYARINNGYIDNEWYEVQ
jgi:hypothetical protein